MIEPPDIRVRPEIRLALFEGRGVVALESTLIAHGLPRPNNLEVAREVEAIVRAEGAVPATIGVLDGEAIVGLDDGQLERIANGSDVRKLSVRDLPAAAALRADGATTVAATAHLAARVGIKLFATGGLGGVHREARETWDESADLGMLGRTSIGVVCAGVKSVLDVGATLERLETLGVTVVGYGTDRFPNFYLTDSGYGLDWRVDTPEQAAAVLVAAERLGLQGQGVVFAQPIPVEQQLDPALHQRILQEGLAQSQGIRGKAITPFLLEHFHQATGGESLRVNRQIVLNNARLAAQIARGLSRV